MDYVLLVLELLGGVGLFLYGMSLMGSSLEKLAGGSLEKILEKLTTGKSKRTGQIKGWGLGTGVTAIIQSSAATTSSGIFVQRNKTLLPNGTRRSPHSTTSGFTGPGLKWRSS